MQNDIIYGRYKISYHIKVGGPIMINIWKKDANGEWEHIRLITLDDPNIAEGGK